MSDHPPGLPPTPPPVRSEGEPFKGGGSILLGLAIGAVLLGLMFLVGVALFGPGIWIAALVYVVGACVVTGVRRWSRLGGGLLLAIGLWILIGAGVCVAQLASGRSVL